MQNTEPNHNIHPSSQTDMWPHSNLKPFHLILLLLAVILVGGCLFGVKTIQNDIESTIANIPEQVSPGYSSLKNQNQKSSKFAITAPDGTVIDPLSPCGQCIVLPSRNLYYDPDFGKPMHQVLNERFGLVGNKVVLTQRYSKLPLQTIEEFPLVENPYKADFAKAYLEYEGIMLGLLEYLAYENSKFKVLGDEDTGSFGKGETVFNLYDKERIARLDYRSQTLAAENLPYVSQLSGVPIETIRSNVGQSIIAMAAALDRVAEDLQIDRNDVNHWPAVVKKIYMAGEPVEIGTQLSLWTIHAAVFFSVDEFVKKYEVPRYHNLRMPALSLFYYNDVVKQGVIGTREVLYGAPGIADFATNEQRLELINQRRLELGFEPISSAKELLRIEAELPKINILGQDSPPGGSFLLTGPNCKHCSVYNTSTSVTDKNVNRHGVENSTCEKVNGAASTDMREEPVHNSPDFRVYWPNEIPPEFLSLPLFNNIHCVGGGALGTGIGACDQTVHQTKNMCNAAMVSVDSIVIHKIQGNLESALVDDVILCAFVYDSGDPNWCTYNGDNNKHFIAGAHYYLGNNGVVVQLVHETRKTNHEKNSNKYAIGIEHEGNNPQPGHDIQDDPNGVMYRNSAILVSRISQLYGINSLSDVFVGPPEYTHGTANGSAVLGQETCLRIKGHHHYGAIKTCPGSNWDWWRYFDSLAVAADRTPIRNGHTEPFGTVASNGFSIDGNNNQDGNFPTSYWSKDSIITNAAVSYLQFDHFEIGDGSVVSIWDNTKFQGAPITVAFTPSGAYINDKHYTDEDLANAEFVSTHGGFSIEFRSDCDDDPSEDLGWQVSWWSEDEYSEKVNDHSDFADNGTSAKAMHLDPSIGKNASGVPGTLNPHNDRPRGWGDHERYRAFPFGGSTPITRSVQGDINNASDVDWYVIELAKNDRPDKHERANGTIELALMQHKNNTGEGVICEVYENATGTALATITPGDVYDYELTVANKSVERIYLKVIAGSQYSAAARWYILGVGSLYVRDFACGSSGPGSNPLTISASPSALQSGGSVQLSTSFDGVVANYDWLDFHLSCNDCANPILMPNNNNNYTSNTYDLEVIDDQGQTHLAAISVPVESTGPTDAGFGVNPFVSMVNQTFNNNFQLKVRIENNTPHPMVGVDAMLILTSGPDMTNIIDTVNWNTVKYIAPMAGGTPGYRDVTFYMRRSQTHIASGNYYLHVIIDPQNDMVETDENNNHWMFPNQTNIVTYGPSTQPDYYIKDVFGLPSMMIPGETYPIDIIIGNKGDGTWWDFLYTVLSFSTNDRGGITDIPIIQDPIFVNSGNDIPPGQEMLLSFNLIVPYGLPSSGYLIFNLDPIFFNSSPSVGYHYEGHGGEANNVVAFPVTIAAPVDLQARITSASPTIACANEAIAFEALECDPNWMYSWDFGDNNTSTGPKVQHIYGADGVYSVTLTTSDGVTTLTDQTTVEVSGFGLGVTIANVSDASCPLSEDGKAEAIPVFIGIGYGFEWSNGAQTPLVENLSPGTHFVTLTDPFGCNSSASVEIGSQSNLAATITPLDYPSCASADNGILQVSYTGINGGKPIINWYGSNDQAVTTLSNNQKKAKKLVPDTYTVEITSGGCTIRESFVLDAVPDFFPEIVPKNNVCGNNPKLGLDFSEGKGNKPYEEIIWIEDGIIVQSGKSNTYGGAIEGSFYDVLIKDDKGCVGEDEGYSFSCSQSIAKKPIASQVHASAFDNFPQSSWVAVMPNPINHQGRIEYLRDHEANLEVRLVNMMGQIVDVFDWQPITSGDQFGFSMEHHPEGIYLIQVIQGNKIRQTHKVVVRH